MDNSIRRENFQLTKFGEATAVLAGNSLLTLAFEIISDSKNFLSSKQKMKLLVY